jgi:pre-mRNA-processing factor 6
MLAFGRAKTKFGKPPPGYVPGIGRGAAGFTTRSDIGPAKNPVATPVVTPGAPLIDPNATLDGATSLFGGARYDREDREADDVYAWVEGRVSKRDGAGAGGKGAGGKGAAGIASARDKARGGGANASDAAAIEMRRAITDAFGDDAIANDARFADPPAGGAAAASSSSSSASSSSSSAAASLSKSENKDAAPADAPAAADDGPVKVQHMFADLAKGLGAVTEDQWASLPDAAEPSGLRKRKREDTNIRTAIPDSAMSMGSGLATSEADGKAASAGVSGSSMPPPSLADLAAPGRESTDLNKVGAVRGTILGARLDQAESGTATSLLSQAGTTSAAATLGYLTGLDRYVFCFRFLVWFLVF